ncbi:MAG: deaminase, partial [Acidobacteria bacterium]
MSKLRVKISMSLDGFVAGPSQSVENPLGIGGTRLHEWVFPLSIWRAMHGLEGGEINGSSRVVEESLANIGASIMGR